MTAYLLDQNACLSDNKFGQNCLDVALALEKEDSAAVIVKHQRWERFTLTNADLSIKTIRVISIETTLYGHIH